MASTLPSNAVGLRFAEESSLKTLPGSPTWYPLDPNSYSGFGGKLSTVARSPISEGRQQQMGTVTGLEASGGFEQDVTQDNLLRLLQGFFFADARQKKTTAPLNAAAIALGTVTGSAHTIAAASGLDGFLAGQLVKLSGFGVAANNGLQKVSTSVAALLTLSAGLSDEASPPAAAKIEACGYEFASATLDVTIASGLPRLNRASGAFDFTTLGLIPGEWIYVNGDSAGTAFANNGGWGRVSAVAAGYIELDKTSWTAQAEVGTGKTVRIFFGTVLKNEATTALIKRRSYQFERQVGDNGTGMQSEYITGAVPNQFTLNLKKKDKVTASLSVLACDNEQRDGATGVKTGTRPTLSAAEAFNTSTDFSRIKLSAVSTTDAAITPLFTFPDEITIELNNNLSAVEALGVLGALDVNAGNFTASGKVTAYFADIAAVQAVRNNTPVTIDVCIAKKNAGMVWDLPYVGLGGGELTVEKDKPITLPLDSTAYASPKFNHTALFNHFPYLPTAAE